jgi:hypothetical protein
MQEVNEAANAAQPQSAAHKRSWAIGLPTSIIDPPSSIHLQRLRSASAAWRACIVKQQSVFSDIPFCLDRNR